MREVTYKCDRCSKKHIRADQIMRINISDGMYDLLDMDLCLECTDKLAAFLGIESLCQEVGDQDV